MVGCHTGSIKVRVVEPEDVEYDPVALLSVSSTVGARVFCVKSPPSKALWCGPTPVPRRPSWIAACPLQLPCSPVCIAGGT